MPWLPFLCTFEFWDFKLGGDKERDGICKQLSVSKSPHCKQLKWMMSVSFSSFLSYFKVILLPKTLLFFSHWSVSSSEFIT